MSELKQNGTANGKYAPLAATVIITVNPGLATALLADVKSGEARTGFGRAFVGKGLGVVERAPLPADSRAANAALVRDDKLAIKTPDFGALREALLFDPEAKSYRRNTGVIALTLA